MPFQKLSDERRGEPSAAIRGRVESARARQSARFANTGGGRGGVTPPLQLTTNADMGPTQVRDFCPVDETGRHTEGARRSDTCTAPCGRQTAGASVQPAHTAEAIHFRSAAAEGVELHGVECGLASSQFCLQARLAETALNLDQNGFHNAINC